MILFDDGSEDKGENLIVSIVSKQTKPKEPISIRKGKKL